VMIAETASRRQRLGATAAQPSTSGQMGPTPTGSPWLSAEPRCIRSGRWRATVID